MTLPRLFVPLVLALLGLSGCASHRPPIDPSEVFHWFPILESDAKSFNKVVLAVSPPHLEITHVASGSSSFSALAGSVPPPAAALAALFFLIGNQYGATGANAAIDADAQLMRVDHFVNPISISASQSLAKSLEAKGYSITIADGVPAVESGDGQTADQYRKASAQRINQLLQTNDAVLTVQYNYEFVRVSNKQVYMPYVAATYGLYRRLDGDRLLHHSAVARTRSRVRAMEGFPSGPVFERADFVDQKGNSAEAIRASLQSEFETANVIFLSEFTASE